MRPLLIVLVVAQTAMACPKGFTPYSKDVCVQDLKPDYRPTMDEMAAETAKQTDRELEKPPRHPEPAYQRGEFAVDMPVSMAGQDAKLDAERDKATAEGRTAAGVPR